MPFGDAPCPNCGHLLWFLNLPGETLIYEHQEAQTIRDRFIELVSQWLGVSREQVLADPSLAKDLIKDSLDLVELVMELEEGLDE